MAIVELIATEEQTVKPGGVILFTEATAINNNSVIHRAGSGLATVRNGGCGCNGRNGAVKCAFGANIAFPATPPAGETAATAPISVALAISGEPDTTTEMVATPAAADEFANISRTTLIPTMRGCCTEISVENTSSGTIVVRDANLIIED